MQRDWEITSQRQTTTVGPGGQIERVFVVCYRTVDGDTGEVEIPVSQFNAARAAAEIETEVAELRKLRNGLE